MLSWNMNVFIIYYLFITSPSIYLSNIYNFRLTFHIWDFCLHMCLCDTCMTESERGMDPPELELKKVMSHHIIAETLTQVLYKRKRGLNHWVIFQFVFYILYFAYSIFCICIFKKVDHCAATVYVCW